MSESEPQLEHRERKGAGGWLIVIFLVLALAYVLSPPWVALLLMRNPAGHEWFETFYMPLRFLSEHFDFVNDFYEAYFELVGWP